MIYAEKGKEQDSFIAFVEYALGILEYFALGEPLVFI